MSQREVLETQLEQLSQEPESCDLLVDLEYLDEDQEIAIDGLASQFDQMLGPSGIGAASS